MDRIFENSETPTVSDEEIKRIIHGTDSDESVTQAVTTATRSVSSTAAPPPPPPPAASQPVVASSLDTAVGSASQWSIDGGEAAEPEFKVPAPKQPKSKTTAAAAASAVADTADGATTKKTTPTTKRKITSIYEFEGQDYSQSQSQSLPQDTITPQVPASNRPEPAALMEGGSGWDIADTERAAKSKAVLESLMVEGGELPSGDDGSSGSGGSGPLIANATRTKRNLTADEVASRHAARRAADEKKKEAAAKKRGEKAKRAAEIRIENWKEAGYASLAIQLDESKESGGGVAGDDAIDASDDGDVMMIERGGAAAAAAGDEKSASSSAAGADMLTSNQLYYEVGDASKPNLRNAPTAIRSKITGSIILNCVDDSGVWGRGGFFRALDSLSPIVAQGYSMAGGADDLHLGDAHLIHVGTAPDTPSDTAAAAAAGGDGSSGETQPPPESLDPAASMDVDSSSAAAAATAGSGGAGSASSSGGGGDLYVCHIVAQKRKKTGGISGIQFDALTLALKKVCQVAKNLNLSVHLPRIGAGTFDFNWYGIERLLKKYLASRQVPTFVYYYKRPGRAASAAAAPPVYGRVASASFFGSPPPKAPVYANRSDDPDFGVSDYDDQMNAAVDTSFGVEDAPAARSSPPPAVATASAPKVSPPTAAGSGGSGGAKVVGKSASGNAVTMAISKREWEAFQQQKKAAAADTKTGGADSDAPPKKKLKTDSPAPTASTKPATAARAPAPPAPAPAPMDTSSELFAGVHVLLDSRIDSGQARTITRYVTAYGGSIEASPSKSVTHIVTTSGAAHIDSTVRNLKRECHSDHVHVTSVEWIEQCVTCGRLLVEGERDENGDSANFLHETPIFEHKRFHLHFPKPNAVTRSPNRSPAPVTVAASPQSGGGSGGGDASINHNNKSRLQDDILSFAGVVQSEIDDSVDYILTDVEYYDDVLRRAVLDHAPPPKIVTVRWLIASIDANTPLDVNSQPGFTPLKARPTPSRTTTAAAASGGGGGGGGISSAKTLFPPSIYHTPPRAAAGGGAVVATTSLAAAASPTRSPPRSPGLRAAQPPTGSGLHHNSPLQSLVDH